MKCLFGRHIRWGIWCVTVFALFSFSSAHADVTGVLRPTADGGNDSADWLTSGGVVCTTASCYLEVDESAGVSCTNSDGDTSYMRSNTNNVAQTFDIDEAAIPDGSTITGISITGCHTRHTGAAAQLQFRYCINNSCTDSGTNIAVGNSYSETTQSFAVNIIKSGSTDLEIGAYDAGGQRLRLSQISTVLTYSPPTPSDTTPPAAVTSLSASSPATSSILLSWTAPGDDGGVGTATAYDLRYSTAPISELTWSAATPVIGEPTPLIAGTSQSMTVTGLSASTTYYFALKTSDEVPNISLISNVPSGSTVTDQSSGGGGNTGGGTGETGGGGENLAPTSPISIGGEPPSNAYFFGQVYPGAKIEFLRRTSVDPRYASVPLTTVAIDEQGVFSISIQNFLQAEYIFAFQVSDKDGRKTGFIPFGFFSKAGQDVIVKDMLIAPTVEIVSQVVGKNGFVETIGYAAPGAKVEVWMDEKNFANTEAGEDGTYRVRSPASNLTFGDHFIKVRQVIASGKISDFSVSRTLRVSALDAHRADFNADGKINVTDWSIFLFRWGSKDETLRGSTDLNGDKKVTIADFSIFLKAISGK